MNDDDHARRDAAFAIANMAGERNTARLERDHFKAEAEQLREDLKVANQNEAALQGHFDIAVENALKAEAETEGLRAENARLRTLVAGVQRAIESVLTDRQTDLRPPASVILSTVVRHLKEVTDD